jgi:hypothetical protein
MTEDNFSNGLTTSGLSLNHKESAEDFQNLGKLTQDRRVTPLLVS